MAERGQLRQLLADMGKTGLASKGCENATAYQPKTVQRAQLPFLYTQRARGAYNWTQHGFESMRENLSLELVVLVAEEDASLRGVAEQEADDYFHLLQNYFGRFRRAVIDATQEVIEITLPGDQGLRMVSFDNKRYYAAVMNVAVSHERTITYQGV